jgi:fructokinase
MKTVGCIELGGTSAAVAVADTIGHFLWQKRGIPTGALAPELAIAGICEELKKAPHKFDTIGVASFGPLNIAQGRMGETPKPGWRDFPLVAAISKHFPGVKIILDTDVNGPAYSEYLALCKEDPSPHCVAYMTIGTGVGLGLVAEGRPYHGLMHPEVGHLSIKKQEGDKFAGACPFHGDCVEGLLSAVSLAKRLGIAQTELPGVPNEHPVWDQFSFYLAEAAVNAALAYAIDKLYVGGGICTGEGRGFLLERANEYAKQLMNGYVAVPSIELPHYLRDAGLVGAAALALRPEAFQK